MGGFGSPLHWMLILIVAVLLFGNRLPEIARSIGRSVNEFKKGLKEVKGDFDEASSNDPPPQRLESTANREPERLDHQKVVEREREAQSETTKHSETTEQSETTEAK